MTALKSNQTRKFYSDLMQGKEKRRLWGTDSRFSPEAICARPSVQKYFLPPVKRHIRSEHTVLDLGCGPGNFLPLVSPLCRELVGADIVPDFVAAARGLVDRLDLANVTVRQSDAILPFDEGCFDRVLMVDTIHHLEDVRSTLEEVHRVLKPGGRLLVFEPNKLNWLLWVMCVLDRNERGLLSLGTFPAYRKAMEGLFRMRDEEWSGLLLGPSSRLATSVADFLDGGLGGKLRFLLPKIFFTAEKI
ncbi:Methyltransferase type 11 [Alkalidesulfovibrio alkalitolerans DSM 16529]|uniref:Methyltransferase type 11 n=1 Tax=Alkalidesulfovibrio alkalitolerans DSM 16529 TaxID=1121439 RepID=S7UNG5_9BACT|nr:class I SAM-dependent methyltransferase [Alkalidesulfovibrio alkalitolerans]EPR35564.1 Methyltransferase type 11 [Alkalidesulfovibrio alkalitolerans DSM 16529]